MTSKVYMKFFFFSFISQILLTPIYGQTKASTLIKLNSKVEKEMKKVKVVKQLDYERDQINRTENIQLKETLFILELKDMGHSQNLESARTLNKKQGEQVLKGKKERDDDVQGRQKQPEQDEERERQEEGKEQDRQEEEQDEAQDAYECGKERWCEEICRAIHSFVIPTLSIFGLLGLYPEAIKVKQGKWL